MYIIEFYCEFILNTFSARVVLAHSLINGSIL